MVWKLVIILTLAEFQFSVNVDVNKLFFKKFLLYIIFFVLFLSAQLEAPSEGEEVDELRDAEEAEAGAEPHQAPEGGDEVLHGVDHVLVELDDALVLEVDVQQGEVALLVVLEAGLLPDLPHHPARLVGEARQAVGRHVLRVGAGRGAETPGQARYFSLFYYCKSKSGM